MELSVLNSTKKVMFVKLIRQSHTITNKLKNTEKSNILTMENFPQWLRKSVENHYYFILNLERYILCCI